MDRGQVSRLARWDCGCRSSTPRGRAAACKVIFSSTTEWQHALHERDAQTMSDAKSSALPVGKQPVKLGFEAIHSVVYGAELVLFVLNHEDAGDRRGETPMTPIPVNINMTARVSRS